MYICPLGGAHDREMYDRAHLLRWRQSSVMGGKTEAHTRKGWRARSSHTGCTGRPQQGARFVTLHPS
jgi:hypothetical protein